MGGQTGQDRTRSAKSRQKVSEAEQTESQRRPLTSQPRLSRQYWLRRVFDSKKGNGQDVELDQAEKDQQSADDCTDGYPRRTRERHLLEEGPRARCDEAPGHHEEQERAQPRATASIASRGRVPQ